MFEKLGVKLIQMLVDLYRNLKPKRLVGACRFSLSCSEYLLLSIDKYGLCVGLKKGVNRLKRCKPPHGGIDNP